MEALKVVASIIEAQFKKIIFLFVLLPICTSSINAQQQSPQAIFGRANQQLQNGNINQALALYNRLEDQNHLSGALFLNMGLSYIRVDSMGKAKYYFLKSQEFESTRKRAREGLEYVENRFSHQPAVLPTLPWEKALNWLENVVGVSNLLAIGLLLLNLGIFGYIILWFKKRVRSFLPKTAISTAVVGLLIILLSFYVDYRAERYQQAVMITRATTVREQPTADATAVSQAFEGYTFNVDRRRSKNHEAWSYIQMSNGQYGWIPTDEIMIL